MTYTTASNGVIMCPVATTSNCVSYQGCAFPTLGICIGESLSNVESTLANNIISLLASVDMTNIIVPSCLSSTFGTSTYTIYNFINTLTQYSCVLQNEITTINSTLSNFNPLITLDYACCSSNPCVSSGTVPLTQAFQNIISCLCSVISTNTAIQNSLITLQTEQQSLQGTIINQQTQITALNNALTNLQFTVIPALQSRVDCLNLATNNNC